MCIPTHHPKEITVWVFKTNIGTESDVKQVAPYFNQLSSIIRWNIALDDCDKILRIESADLEAQEIIDLVSGTGYSCEELPD